MKRILFIAILCFCLGNTFAQELVLKGQTTYHEQPYPNVNIKVLNTDINIYSDDKGHFQLLLSPGEYTLIFKRGAEKTVFINLQQSQSLTVDMSDAVNHLEEVFLSSIRVDANSPITHSNMDHQEIQERNLGQDIPILMNYMPNVVTTSDAGAGVGYTGIRVRGSDPTRVNVTINGIPLNDAESQSTLWVDLGDFTSSIENLQLQRGVGTSTNGAGAFGASLNVLTESIKDRASVEITNTYGSFNTHKHQIEFNSGRVGKYFAFSGSTSILKSEGYRDRAFSDLRSYFLQGIFEKGNTKIKALSFGGSEETYQAYYGITAEQMKENRRFNPAGMYTDSTGTVQFYDNQTDNYKQDHLQLLWNQRYNNYWSSNIALHYTYGRGFYESFHEDADLEEYGMPYFNYNNQLQTTSDLINEKWLDNRFYGTVFSVTYQKNRIKAILGGAWNQYKGDHYGKIIYTRFAINQNPFKHYYDNAATKNDFNVYAKLTWALTDKLTAFGDLQYRSVHYHTNGPLEEKIDFNIEDDLHFFNPKFGLTYQINTEHQLYFSYARANREPSRADYQSAVLSNPEQPKYPQAEQLNDYELGWRYHSDNLQLSSNLYYMDYHNQLVLTGEIDDEGAFIRQNSGESYRLGLEINAAIRVSDKFEIRPNLSLSQNKNIDFKADNNGQLENFGDTDISFSPNIVAGNMIRYSPLPNLQINFLTKFVGEQYMSNIEADASILDSYLVNSLNIQYVWKNVPLFKEAVFSGLLNNIFDEKYISNGYYSPGYGASYYPQAGINFLTGITLKF